VIGVGGAGGNAVNNMIVRGLGGVEYLVCNTDAQALATTLTENRLQLGRDITRGGLGWLPWNASPACTLPSSHVPVYHPCRWALPYPPSVPTGLGCGANPDIGRVAAEESKAELLER
jgi:cell division protein FtsZ